MKLYQTTQARGPSRSLASFGLLVLLTGSGLLACTPQPPAPTPESEVTESPTATSDPETTATSALADKIGESFYFHGAFQNQLSDALFVVQEDEDRGWGEVLVLNQSDRAFSVPTDAATPLWIYGTIEELTQAELETNEVPESAWADYEGQPVVIAERITLVPTPEELVENADSFLNQQVTVYGNVQPVEAANTFILENPSLFSGKGIILIQGANVDLDKVADSEQAVVSGVLRPYVLADLKQEYDLPWELDLQERLEADFEQSPVIVVDQALPVNN
jgi:hypothetical protein